MQSPGLGIESITEQERGEQDNIEELQEQIEKLENELAGVGSAPPTLEYYLKLVIENLGAPGHCLQLKRISLRFDHMGIIRQADTSETVLDLQLDELSFADGRRVLVLPVCIAAADVPGQRSFQQEAKRYL